MTLGTPTWLYYLFGGLMLLVAAYCFVLLLATAETRRHPGWDVDVAHILMGVAMAGMFVTNWAFGPTAMWELIFAALLVWFIVRTIQSIQQYGLHLPHQLIHAAMSLAMLLMYSFPPRTGGASSVSMAMSAGSGSRLDPGLGLLLTVSFFASAIFTVASTNKGASHHGRHGPIPNVAIAGNEAAPEDGVAVAIAQIERIVTMPWLEDASHVVMCVGMGFLLILMM